MRYRPFARTGMAVSCLSISLNGARADLRPGDWRGLIHAAFEEGINTFELVNPTMDLLAGFADGVSAVKRSLLFTALRVDATVEARRLQHWVEDTVAAASIDHLNLLTVDAGASYATDVLGDLLLMRETGLTKRLAVIGDGELLADDVEAGHFDAIVTAFSMRSNWRDRNLLRVALERQMGVIAIDPFPAELASLAAVATSETKPKWYKKPKPLAGTGTYAFLEKTRGWTAHQLCLAYALTEPAVATVMLELDDPKTLAELASTSDRDLPSTVSAQIEMARFSEGAVAAEESARRSA
jgi:aryl-alcohol dehydrogenase-like predicted oxidoreductase